MQDTFFDKILTKDYHDLLKFSRDLLTIYTVLNAQSYCKMHDFLSAHSAAPEKYDGSSNFKPALHIFWHHLGKNENQSLDTRHLKDAFLNVLYYCHETEMNEDVIEELKNRQLLNIYAKTNKSRESGSTFESFVLILLHYIAEQALMANPKDHSKNQEYRTKVKQLLLRCSEQETFASKAYLYLQAQNLQNPSLNIDSLLDQDDQIVQPLINTIQSINLKASQNIEDGVSCETASVSAVIEVIKPTLIQHLADVDPETSKQILNKIEDLPDQASMLYHYIMLCAHPTHKNTILSHSGDIASNPLAQAFKVIETYNTTHEKHNVNPSPVTSSLFHMVAQYVAPEMDSESPLLNTKSTIFQRVQGFLFSRYKSAKNALLVSNIDKMPSNQSLVSLYCYLFPQYAQKVTDQSESFDPQQRPEEINEIIFTALASAAALVVCLIFSISCMIYAPLLFHRVPPLSILCYCLTSTFIASAVFFGTGACVAYVATNHLSHLFSDKNEVKEPLIPKGTPFQKTTPTASAH